jgi:hypothetical protein
VALPPVFTAVLSHQQQAVGPRCVADAINNEGNLQQDSALVLWYFKVHVAPPSAEDAIISLAPQTQNTLPSAVMFAAGNGVATSDQALADVVVWGGTESSISTLFAAISLKHFLQCHCGCNDVLAWLVRQGLPFVLTNA